MQEIRLASRPSGWPTADNFELVELPTPEPGPGQVLVRNQFMSVDPYMRGRMNDVESYVAPFQLGKPLDGAAVGEVVASNAADVPVGATVLHGLGWRDYAVLDAAHVRAVDPAAAPTPSAYLGLLGMTGLTAYVGLLDIAQFREGDTVFVSGAAGAVGSVAGQVAKLRGAKRVIGSAGSAEKVRYLVDELGFDAAFNYKDAPVRDQLREAAPDGIDVYFDNVGGDHLEAAISSLNKYGRVALCGAIAQYNDTAPPAAPRNLALAIGKELTLRGFIVSNHNKRMPDFVAEVGAWLRAGQISAQETVVEGLAGAPEAFLGLLRGENTGKMVIKL
ncbi:NADP-dependent oxidoreductase [Actinoplanes ianthinogenes]|uniref:NADP-dependent oxidoreductase n=1 Tax=Actinoplanes ianthinogenes TaxID=122358 RepID=A0ABM7LN73_9ACTN|nr:NADP-dependent oxidoreductase [Actinoplanes ianthinogenes]BCJ40634.1 NADP-dependent oxidoreductase [Actinoplanes ianthinogenes]GGR43966.1 NADP-dependent oxidoreductase [Actinoplanes ianthinogenes]